MLKARFHKNSDRGAALVETALVIPVLVLLLIGVYYINARMHAHGLITNIAQEGSRFLARRASLGANPRRSQIFMLTDDPNTTADETALVPLNVLGNHAAGHQYMRRLLVAMNTRDSTFRITQIQIETELITDISSTSNPSGSGSTAGEETDRIQAIIRATMEPDGLFPETMLAPIGLSPLTVAVTSNHPYLFRAQNVGANNGS